MELETAQSFLQDSGIEVDLQNLQNPTEEFMIDLIIQYLEKFKIDGNEISKPTPEQLKCAYNYESLFNVIRTINLHSALSKLCESIFLRDFLLTDITSPGCKKTCKRIKLLLNFCIYVRNKKLEKASILCELEDRLKESEELINKKDDLVAQVESVINERKLKLKMLEKLKKEIEEVKSKMEEAEKANQKENISKQVEEITQKYQTALNNYNNKKEKAQELLTTTKNLQSKIVESPKEYTERMEKLKKLLEEKLEERQSLNESINRKKTQIRNHELGANEVKADQSKILQIGEIMKKSKEINAQIDITKKNIDELKKEIELLKSIGPKSKRENLNDKGDEDFEKSQKLLMELSHSLADKEREFNSLKDKLEALKSEERTESKRLQQEMEALTNAQKKSELEIQEYEKVFKTMIEEEIEFRKMLANMNLN